MVLDAVGHLSGWQPPSGSHSSCREFSLSLSLNHLVGTFCVVCFVCVGAFGLELLCPGHVESGVVGTAIGAYG